MLEDKGTQRSARTIAGVALAVALVSGGGARSRLMVLP